MSEPFARYVRSLIEGERLCVGGPEALAAAVVTGADDALAALDAAARVDAPADAPLLSLPAARWGAATLYKACQLLVHRELASIGFGPPPPLEPGPRAAAAAAWSCDLALRHLPDVLIMARRAAPADPLVAALLDLARRFPLSSIGIAGLDGRLELDGILADPCLGRLYVERVIARSDRSRFADPRVVEAIRTALGAHAGLAPEIAAALAGETAAA